MDMDKYIGRLLDNRYEILEVLGVGGMAVVYKARCHRLNRLVAIKILKAEYTQDEEFRRRFHAESQAVAMLSHPNIESVYDVSTTDEADYIVMELIDGITLKQYMEKMGVLNWKETLHIAIQIAKALDHAHSRGIIHRDIKPHNVMVLKNGSVKVTDFGIARAMSKGSTLTKEALGSVHYISPEQAKGGRVDNRSDIYSLGIVMYEMMTGRPPYDGESPVAVAIQHINGKAQMPSVLNPNIPGGLEQIIMKAMAHSPADRYASATTMLYDMDEFRKDPAILFDYQNPGAGVGDGLNNRSTPKAVPVPPPTTAEKVAGNTGPLKQRPVQQPARNPQPQRRRREVVIEEDEGHSKVATVAIIVCVVVIILALIACGVAIFMQPGEQVDIPNLLGQNLTDAKALAEKAGLTIKIDERKHSETYEKDQIMNQTPAFGGKIIKGGEITVIVSLGPEPQELIMENLVELDEQQAKDFLIGQGIEEGKILIRTENHSTIPVGQVIRTDPAEGESLTQAKSICLWISLGPQKEMKKVPNVQGYSLETALLVLDRNGFKNVLTEPVESSKAKDTVISQSEIPYTEIDVTTEIVLQVSIGLGNTSTTPKDPEDIFEDENVRKVFTVILPTDVIGDYTLTVKLGDEIIEEREIFAGTISADFEVSGTGKKEYAIWIGENPYTVVPVDFGTNG